MKSFYIANIALEAAMRAIEKGPDQLKSFHHRYPKRESGAELCEQSHTAVQTHKLDDLSHRRCEALSAE